MKKRLSIVMLAAAAVAGAVAPARPGAPAPQAVTLSPDRVYEIAALWVKPDKAAQLQRYFAEAMPVAMAHGARPLASFRPVKAHRGEFLPTTISLAEWPSASAFDAFSRDPKYLALVPQRDSALDQAVVVHSRVAERIAVELHADRVYELAALWPKPEAHSQLADYFARAMPIAIRHGAKPLVAFTPTRSPIGNFLPPMLSLSEWASAPGFERFLNDPAMARLAPARDAALERAIVTHAVLNAPRPPTAQ